eukprot:m.755767 g.755767  ORF g.755767 m.755767 type:complete len:51 (+) comp23183_c0_seq19:1393-1545(+)
MMFIGGFNFDRVDMVDVISVSANAIIRVHIHTICYFDFCTWVNWGACVIA